MHKTSFSWKVLVIFFTLTMACLMISHPVLGRSDEVKGREKYSGTTTMTETGVTMVVTNTSEAVNGDTSSPEALILDPGPDGISLTEAIMASESTIAYDTIEFDPSLDGAVIALTNSLPLITQGNLMIDGDIDNDTLPNIALDGTSGGVVDALRLMGASHVVIQGLDIRNFSGTGVTITPDTASGAPVVEDLVFRYNSVSNSGYGVTVLIWNQDHTEIRNVEIISNTLQNNGIGVWVTAGIGDSASDNQISRLSIAGNTILNSGYKIAIFVSPANSSGISRNTVTDVEITGNQISGHTNTSILVDAANQSGCNENSIQGVLIANNQVDGAAVTIELVSVGESGSNATGNMMSDVTIQDNILTSGGIQFGGSTGYDSNNNTISGVLIDRNYISGSAANGIYLVAGSGGAHDNLIENVVIRNSFVHESIGAGILLHGEDSLSPNNTMSGITITNVTLVENGNPDWAGGLNINTKNASNTITGVTLSSSIMEGNAGDDAIRGSLVPDSVTYSHLGDLRFVGSNGNIDESPMFADQEEGDYRLQPSSPCVDTGNPMALDAGPEDLDNKLRVWDGDDDTIAIIDRGAWEYNSITPQEMDVQGNGISILDGDTESNTIDGTDFGNTSIAGEVITHTFTIENSGQADLNLTGYPRAEITGTHSADFSIISQPGSPIIGGGSTTFTLTFEPGGLGLRKATITIANNDSNENPYDFVIQGTGIIKIYLPLVIR